VKTRIIAVAAAAILAIIGAVVLVVAVRSADAANVAGAQLQSVLVVKQEVPAGTSADHLGDAVTVEQIPAAYVADDAIGSLDDIAGLVAAVNLKPGEQVLESRFASSIDLASTGVHIAVPEGLQEVSVAVDLQRIAGGAIGPGDRVGVFASFDKDAVPSAKGEPVTGQLFDQVLVTSVASTVDPDADEQQAQGLVLVTLALDSDGATKLVGAAEFGHIWMTGQNDETTAGTTDGVVSYLHDKPTGGAGAHK
jgi:pilus assembly protein CpaB